MLFALEPHPGAAKLLRAALGTRRGCAVLEVAAAETDSSAELIVPLGAFGSPVSGLAWVKRDQEADPATSIPIRLCRLDGLIDDGTMSVVGPVFMKIDVEGGEAGVLRGAADLLRRHRPILYFECQTASLARQGETPEGVWADLGKAGYHMFGNRAGRFVRLPGVDVEIVNYLGIPDLAATDLVDLLDATALDRTLHAWAARTRQDGDIAR
jgi:FkbM family methyltransferase